MYHGDIRLESTIHIKFYLGDLGSTVGAGVNVGLPTALLGTPVVSAYPANSTTQLTAGITLTASFDSVTALNNVSVAATAANGYAAGTDYALVLTAGTVDSLSVVGMVIGSFSIENRSAVMPTTVGRTLDVSAGGEAGVDWANVGNPATAQNLSATNIDADQVVASVSGAVGSVTGAVGSVTAGVTLAASAVQAIWDALTSALTTAGSIGKLLVDNVNAAVSSRATPAQVNTEVLDVMTVDTFAEASAVPAATSTLKDKINWLFALARNKLSQSATTQTLRNDADSASIATAAVADDGTTASRAEWS